MDDLVSNEVARPNKALQLTVNFLRRRLIYGVRTPTGPAATPTAVSGSCLATNLTASVSLVIPLSHTHIDLTGFAVSRFTVPVLWNSRRQINLVRRLRRRYADLGHGR